MSLDISLKCKCCESELYSGNITHNLNKMAGEAGIYSAMWKPDSLGAVIASDITEFLRDGLDLLEANPLRFKEFDSTNGWGIYEHFVPFVREYLNACVKYPDSLIEVWV